MRQHRVSYSVDEAAGLVGLPRTTIYEAIRRGDLRSSRVGSRIVVPARALEEMLGAGTPDGQEPDADPDEGINRIQLAGRLMQTPELKTSRRGLNYCTLRLTVGHADDSDAVEIDLVAFGRRAQIAASCTEGQPLRIEGRFTQRQWQAEDGAQRKSVRIVADRVHALSVERPEVAAS